MTLRQYFSLWYLFWWWKKKKKVSYFFYPVEILLGWFTAVSCEGKICFFCLSSPAIQQKWQMCCYCKCMNYQKAFSHKVRHKNLCWKAAKDNFQIWATSLQLWNSVSFCLCVLKQLLISRPLQTGFVLVFALQGEVRICWMKAWVSSCSFDYSYSAAGATLPPVVNTSFDDTSSILF